METVLSAVQWVLFKTIYGSALVAGLTFLIFAGLRRFWSRSPNPALLAGAAFLISVLTLPSVPRYQFEREVRTVMAQPWVRVVSEAYWGHLTEPLTLIRTPLGAVTMVMPEAFPNEGFRQVIFRYNEKPDVSFVEPYCNDFTAHHFRPDEKGTIRYTSTEPQKMDEFERRVYCSDSWEKEKEELRKHLLGQVATPE